MSAKSSVHPFEWDAHTPKEKASARGMVKAGMAKIIHRSHSTYISKHRLVSYEAWSLQLTEKHPDYHKE